MKNKKTLYTIILLMTFTLLNAQDIKTKIHTKKAKGKITYFIKDGIVLTKLGSKLFYRKKKNKSIQISSIDNTNTVIDTMNLPLMRQGNRVKSFNSLNYEIIAYDDFRMSCPGGGETTYIVRKKNGKFHKIISSHYHTLGESTIYFPMKVRNKKLLVQIKDYKTSCYTYPKQFNIPIEDLIIKTNKGYLEDIEGLYGEEIIVKSLTSDFYRWNGSKLIKIKRIDHKKPILKNITTNYPIKGKAYVIAKSGLRYRKSPNVKSPIFGTFDFGTEIMIVKNTGIKFELEDNSKKLKGQWVKVKSRNNRKDKYSFDNDKYSGYVFNGFLIDSDSIQVKK